MGKNQSASNLTNIIKQDASGNITFVSGSTTLMSVSSSGAVTTTGNVAGTASYAANADLLDGLNSTVFATTGSNTFAGIQTVNSNLVVTGSITAQTLVVQTITSSVDFVTGSTRFGSLAANTHTFTGSVLVSGSISSISPITSSAVLVNPAGPGFITIGATTSYGSVSSGGSGLTFYMNGATRGGTTTAGSNVGVIATNGDFYFTNGAVDSTKLFIASSGSIGIGTSTITEGTQAVSSISIFPSSSVSSGPLIQFASNGRIRPASTGDRLSIDGNSLYLNSYIGSNILANIAGGNFGIGTSSPSQLLHIEKSQNATTTLLIQNTADGSGAAAELRFYGNTGVGSLKNNQQISFVRGSGGVDWALGQLTDSDDFVIAGGTNQGDGKPSLATSERMRISSAGNFTIGGNIALGGVLNVGNSYDVPNALTIQTDANWTFGCSNVSSNYWMQTKFYGDGTDTRGFRVYNVQNALVEFRINGLGNAYTRGTLTQNASDKRLKTNIVNIDKALEKVMSINGVNFDWIENIEELGFSPKIKKNDAGLLAQEIQSVLPQAIDNAPFDYENGKSRSGENYLTVQYEKIVPLLVEAIKELKAENDTLKEILQRNNIQ